MVWHSVDYHISKRDTLSLKGVAICAMLIHHLFIDESAYGVFPQYFAIVGKICVAIFVFVSAYGLTIQLKKYSDGKLRVPHFSRLLIKRYLKFYFNYWFVFIISVVLGVYLFGRTLGEAYGDSSNIFVRFIVDFLGCGEFWSYNITWWFNRVILALWLLFPLLYWLMSCRVASLFALLLFFLNPGDILYPLNFIAASLPFYVLPFSMGIWLAVHETSIDLFLKKINPSVLWGLSVAVLGLCFFARINDLLVWYTIDAVATLFLALLVVLCNNWFPKQSVLAFLGKHSMNIYLLHTFIFGYFFHDFVYGFNNAFASFIILLSISLLLSMLIEYLKNKLKFYQLLERICKCVS
jgi:peptidoglycan/LPS O-acetylase OafA/YrhL